MKTDKENEWREEFRKHWFHGSEWHHNTQTALSIERHSEPYKLELRGYLQACRARQVDIDNLKMFQCPNYVTTDNGYIFCNLDKHRLKTELEKARELINFVNNCDLLYVDDLQHYVKEFLKKESE